jgi:hypothetical protein
MTAQPCMLDQDLNIGCHISRSTTRCVPLDILSGVDGTHRVRYSNCLGVPSYMAMSCGRHRIIEQTGTLRWPMCTLKMGECLHLLGQGRKTSWCRIKRREDGVFTMHPSHSISSCQLGILKFILMYSTYLGMSFIPTLTYCEVL